MTATDRWNSEAMARAQYYAVRTITMAVVAFVGLILATVAIAAIVVFVIADDPLGYPQWADTLIMVLAIAGGGWFVVFLAMSLHALRGHSWFHRQLI